MMGFSKDSRERNMLGDFYRLYEKWHEVPESRDAGYWEALIRETDEYAAKYNTGHDETASHLASIVLGHVYDRSRGADVVNAVERTDILQVMASMLGTGMIGGGR